VTAITFSKSMCLLLINARSEKSAKLWTTLETIYLLCTSRSSQLVPFQHCWIGIHRALETLRGVLDLGELSASSVDRIYVLPNSPSMSRLVRSDDYKRLRT
jgi:hypothetical protein